MTWHLSPHLSAWQKKCVHQLQQRVGLRENRNVHWFLSSGTQSVNTVKAIALGDEALDVAAHAVNRHLSATLLDRWGLAIPEYHIGGYAIERRARLSQSKVVRWKNKWNPKLFAKWIGQNAITLTSLVPTQVFDLNRAGIESPACLRAVVVGGGHLSSTEYAQARDLGWPVLPSYGLTECSSQVATATLESLKRNEYPKLTALEHVKLKVNFESRLMIQSAALSRLNATINTDGQFQMWQPQRNDWLLTEDIVRLEGRTLEPLGRADSVVKVRGVLVSLVELHSEVQKILHDNNFSELFVLAAVRDPRLEHKICLFTDSNKSLHEWSHQLNFVNSRLSGLKRIHIVAWVPELPATDLKKIKVKQLLTQLGF